MNRKGACGLLTLLLTATLLAGCAAPEEAEGPPDTEPPAADEQDVMDAPIENELPPEPTLGERTAEDVDRAA